MKMFLLSFIFCLICIKAAFKSYDGSNCAYVYDTALDAPYPLDVCITDYDADHPFPYQSREYVCTISADGTADIEAYTYYGQNCTGSFSETRSVLGADNEAYRCGDGESTTYDACYLEYKEYAVGSDCSEYQTASYSTKYVIVGVCVNTARNIYYRCDSSGASTDAYYVEFIDDECCDLAYSYTSYGGADWKTMSIETGCDAENEVYIDPDSWKCMIADAADDEDVITDNTDEECVNDAPLLSLYVVVMTVFVMIMC